MTVKVCITGEIHNEPVIIEAFPSKGYVSTLAANHMIKELGMELVGHISCDKFDAIAVVHEGKPLHPIRIYKKDNLIVVFSELIIPFTMTHETTEAISNWFSVINPKSALLLASIPGMKSDKEHEILSVTTDDELKEKLVGLGVKMMDEGVLTGMSSSLLLSCCEQKIKATALMVETSYVPDVLAAATLVEVISKVLMIDIDTKELIKAGTQIKEKFRNNLEQIKKGQEDYKQLHEESAMYR